MHLLAVSRPLIAKFIRCYSKGYKRSLVVQNNRTSTPLDVDVNVIDDHLCQLALFDQATCYSKQKTLLQRELEIFFPLCQALLLCRLLQHMIFAGSWCIKTRMGKPRFIVTGGKRGTIECTCPVLSSYRPK